MTVSEENWSDVYHLEEANVAMTQFCKILDKHIKRDISNEFNKYFISIGGELSDVTNSSDYIPEVVDCESSFGSFANLPVSEIELNTHILTLKSNKAPGPDNYSAKMLKSISPSILAPLCYIFNLVLNRGFF